MGFHLFSNNGQVQYGIKNYIADFKADLQNIPKNPGNMVFVIEESKYYITNNKQDWIEYKINNSTEKSNIEIDITENGRHDVSSATTANVNVPVGVFPNGEEIITENGNYNITEKESVCVTVPQGVFPEGTKVITQNVTGEDVTNYAAVDVAVPEYDDGGWGREVGAPNLDLLRLPGRECASGSGYHVLFMSYYLEKTYDIDTYRPRLSEYSDIKNINDVTINHDGTYTVNEEIVHQDGGRISLPQSVRSAGWHVIRIEYKSSFAYTFGFYSGADWVVPFYEAISCGINVINKFPQYSMCIIDAVITGSLSEKFNVKRDLRNIKFINVDTSAVTNMQSMFNGCANLRNLDLSCFDTSNVTTMARMFYDCNSLQSVNLSSFDTGNVTSVNWMFNKCYYLYDVDISSFDMSSMTNISLYDNASNLIKIKYPDNKIHQFPITGTPTKTWTANPETAMTTSANILKSSYLKDVIDFPIIHCSFSINSSNYLTVDSLLTIFNALPEVETSQTVTIGATNIAKLTADQIAIAQDKGWTVA